MIHSVVFSLQDTPNFKVNVEKLDIQIKTSPISASMTVEVIGKEIIFRFDAPLIESDLTQLIGIINTHDGQPPKAFDHTLVQQREDVILKMNQMGQYHPLISDNELVEYLTSIDNHLNAWRRSSNPVVVLAQIFADSGVSDIAGTEALQEDGVTPVDTSVLPFYGFLHTVSNPVTGAKVFQFIAASIANAS